MDEYSPQALWTAFVGRRELDGSAPFGQRAYERIVRLVPYWRASTEAWRLSNDSYLVGIGVLRNYGGDLMVITIDSLDDEAIGQLLALLQRDISLEHGRIENIFVLVDDALIGFDELPATLGRLDRLRWSDAEALVKYVTKDEPEVELG